MGRSPLVIAMHDMELATSLATRVVVLAGRPATVAYQAEIGADPATVRADLARRFALVSDLTPTVGTTDLLRRGRS